MLDSTRSKGCKEGQQILRDLADTLQQMRQEENPDPGIKWAIARTRVEMIDMKMKIIARALDDTIVGNVTQMMEQRRHVKIQYSRPATKDELTEVLAQWWEMTTQLFDAHAELLHIEVPETGDVAACRAKVVESFLSGMNKSVRGMVRHWYSHNKHLSPIPPGMVTFSSFPGGVNQDYLDGLIIEAALGVCPTKSCSVNWGLHQVQLDDGFADVPIAWVSLQ